MPLDHTSTFVAGARAPTHVYRIAQSLATLPPVFESADALRRAFTMLAAAHAAALPLPGRGQTIERWRVLGAVAAYDLSLVKWYEGHTDALAIMADLGASPPQPDTTWGVWAAESKHARLEVSDEVGGAVRVTGRKSWCSGAALVSHALVTAWDVEKRPRLIAVPMRQPGVRITDEGWSAIGMAASGSVDVLFDDAEGWAVGGPADYTSRPGFWHGGAGIAACWFGAAARIGAVLAAHVAARPEPHASAHLGALSVTLSSTRALLREAALAIDADPASPHVARVLQARAAAESAATAALDHAGRAMGASPFCRDAAFARVAADLPVFIRQTHAERDLETLGKMIAQERPHHWPL